MTLLVWVLRPTWALFLHVHMCFDSNCRDMCARQSPAPLMPYRTTAQFTPELLVFFLD